MAADYSHWLIPNREDELGGSDQVPVVASLPAYITLQPSRNGAQLDYIVLDLPQNGPSVNSGKKASRFLSQNVL